MKNNHHSIKLTVLTKSAAILLLVAVLSTSANALSESVVGITGDNYQTITHSSEIIYDAVILEDIEYSIESTQQMDTNYESHYLGNSHYLGTSTTEQINNINQLIVNT